MKNIIKLIVNESKNETRVDLFITKERKELSRTRVKKLILNENLKINNLIIKDPSKKVYSGDKIIFCNYYKSRCIFINSVHDSWS